MWSFSTGTLRGHEGNPLVIGNVMYVQSSFPNKVYALDLAKDGAPQIWQYTPEQDANTIPIACCDVVNRGVAWHPPTADHPAGIIYIELLQGDLLALDAKTGKKVYQVKSADFKTGSTMTNCPLVVKNVVLTGISGGEFGVRGRITAFDALDGHELWRTYSTGPDKDVGITANTLASPYPSAQGKDLGVSTWQGDEWMRGGGTTWGWYSYDPELNLFYHGSGNPGTLEPGPASRRQQVVDVDLGAEPGDGRGQVGVPDDPARCLGLRWCQRDGAHRPDDRWQDGEGAHALRPERHSATRSTGRMARCSSPTPTAR